MRVLVVKTSSMGDIIHTLPALTDAAAHHPNLCFDWVVEEAFSEIPSWHPKVARVIPIAWRRWRKKLWYRKNLRELGQFWRTLRASRYDCIIDAQGLIKSALLTLLPQGPSCGLDFDSARESWSAACYTRHIAIRAGLHAVLRTRTLFAKSLGYLCPKTHPQYAIRHQKKVAFLSRPYIVFVHGTTKAYKYWPEAHWISLAQYCLSKNWHIKIPWGTRAEYERSVRIAKIHPNVVVLPKTSLYDVAQVLLQARGVVAVDTGICHLAAALDVPAVSLYSHTDPKKIGAYGKSQIHLQAKPNMQNITPACVWEHLLTLPANIDKQ